MNSLIERGDHIRFVFELYKVELEKIRKKDMSIDMEHHVYDQALDRALHQWGIFESGMGLCSEPCTRDMAEKYGDLQKQLKVMEMEKEKLNIMLNKSMANGGSLVKESV